MRGRRTGYHKALTSIRDASIVYSNYFNAPRHYLMSVVGRLVGRKRKPLANSKLIKGLSLIYGGEGGI